MYVLGKNFELKECNKDKENYVEFFIRFLI